LNPQVNPFSFVVYFAEWVNVNATYGDDARGHTFFQWRSAGWGRALSSFLDPIVICQQPPGLFSAPVHGDKTARHRTG